MDRQSFMLKYLGLDVPNFDGCHHFDDLISMQQCLWFCIPHLETQQTIIVASSFAFRYQQANMVYSYTGKQKVLQQALLVLLPIRFKMVTRFFLVGMYLTGVKTMWVCKWLRRELTLRIYTNLHIKPNTAELTITINTSRDMQN